MIEVENVEAGLNDIQDVISDIISPDGGMSSEEVLEMLEQAGEWIAGLIEGIEGDVATHAQAE